jgi:chromate reductase, NAD(P)H dehydrogenase (quinone)
MTRKIAVLVGSLRKDSFNLKIARALPQLAPEGVTFEIVEIGDLPFYNQDLETDAPPPQWRRFREQIKSADAVLFVTPEYNRSLPGALKNALDVGSRPYGASVWAGRPAAVISSSMGAIGGFGANHHLRQSLVFLDMPVLQQPEAYIGATHELFDEGGALTGEATRQFLTKFATAFAAWIEKTAPARSAARAAA